MFAIWGIALTLLKGVSFLLPFLKGIMGGAFKFLQARMDAEVEKRRIDATVAVESIRADVQIAGLRVEMNKVYMGWTVTRWIVPLIAYPLIFHVASVVLYSIFLCRACAFPQSWTIAALPVPMNEWEGQIIMSFFIVRGGEIVASVIRSGSIMDRIKDVMDAVIGGSSISQTIPQIKTNYKGGRK